MPDTFIPVLVRSVSDMPSGAMAGTGKLLATIPAGVSLAWTVGGVMKGAVIA
jgi:hypothetical protein